MPKVWISIHADGEPEFETTDEGTIAAIRRSLGPPSVDTWLVPAHDLAATLMQCGRALWANVLLHEEEPHVVTVRFSD